MVIPVYNAAAWLDDCLASVLAQSEVTLEVICVDDGSTDESSAVLKRYAAADPRVTIMHQENRGQSVARNAGVDAANGRYLVYVDSDDFWPSDTLAELVRAADDDSLDVLLFDCYAFRDGDIPDATWIRYEHYYDRSREYRPVRPGPQMMADMRRRRDYRPHVGMYIARTDFVRRIGVRFIPGIVHQDNPYTFALLLAAARTSHLRRDVYARRMRPGSTITALDDARSAKGYFLSYLEMSERISGSVFSDDVAEMVSDVVYSAFAGAHRKIILFTPTEREAIRQLDTSATAQLAFRTMTTTVPG